MVALQVSARMALTVEGPHSGPSPVALPCFSDSLAEHQAEALQHTEAAVAEAMAALESLALVPLVAMAVPVEHQQYRAHQLITGAVAVAA